MAPDRIEQAVRGTIADRLGLPDEKVQPDSALVEDLGADSLDIVELVLAMEDAFRIEIPDDEVGGLRTVQDTVDYVAARV